MPVDTHAKIINSRAVQLLCLEWKGCYCAQSLKHLIVLPLAISKYGTIGCSIIGLRLLHLNLKSQILQILCDPPILDSKYVHTVRA